MLLCCHRDRGHVVKAPGRCYRTLSRFPPPLRIDLGGVGVRRPPVAHQRARVGVADDDLARLGGGVDPRDECHGDWVGEPARRRRAQTGTDGSRGARDALRFEMSTSGPWSVRPDGSASAEHMLDGQLVEVREAVAVRGGGLEVELLEGRPVGEKLEVGLGT